MFANTEVRHLIAGVKAGAYDRLDGVDNARLGEAVSRLDLLATGLKVAVTAASLLLALSLGGASAAETLTYTSPTTGRTLTLPFIGTPAFSDSCTIYAAWEDHSALAFCAEDGTSWAYHPYQPNTKPAGWYPVTP